MIIPMVARLVPNPLDRDGWLFEIKWDGFRAIAETDGARNLSLYSRKHNDFKKRFPTDRRSSRRAEAPGCAGCEIVALDEQGKPRFEWVMNRGPQLGTLVSYVFDLLSLNGKVCGGCL